MLCPRCPSPSSRRCLPISRGALVLRAYFTGLQGVVFFQRFSHVVVLFCSFNGSFCFGRIFFFCGSISILFLLLEQYFCCPFAPVRLLKPGRPPGGPGFVRRPEYGFWRKAADIWEMSLPFWAPLGSKKKDAWPLFYVAHDICMPNFFTWCFFFPSPTP